MGVCLAYGVVIRDTPVGHEVSKPGWFLHLYDMDFISLHLSCNMGGQGDPFLDTCANCYKDRYEVFH